ncbi:MAG: 2-amino-4-hydroxy-6-hydroxymethyldihydropteridine diphosphokinase [Bacteroidaceae bacterium]|nr:2-amino-4-hydroxy-6-hydroxymethyldihydropteridine diphosphokinase [Bacteroidaceae bacterium]
MNKYVLSIGSNCPVRQANMMNLIRLLKREFPTDFWISETYESPALNGISPAYLNAVAVVFSEQNHNDMRSMMKSFEQKFGRNTESKKSGIVEMDLDIVIVNDEIVRPKDYARDYFTIGYNQFK